MLVDGQVLSATISPMEGVWLIIKSGVVVLAVLYFIFSLIVVRQVNLMTETLITELSPLLRAFAILHSGLTLGIILLLIGYLFS